LVLAAVALIGLKGGSARRVAGPTVLLVAAALTHWVFLAIAAAALGLAAVLALPRSMRLRHAGVPLMATESGTLATVLAATGIAASARWAAGWVTGRAGRGAGLVALAAAVGALAVPGAIGWYRHAPEVWIDAAGLREATAAGRYMEGLPPGDQVVFLVGPTGP